MGKDIERSIQEYDESVSKRGKKKALKLNPDANMEDLNVMRPHNPIWISSNTWNGLIDKWLDDKWQHKSMVGTQNRMTLKDGSITKHTGGSKSFASHKRKLATELGREPTLIEQFDRVHKQKGGEFVDNKSKRVSEQYVASLTSKFGPEPSTYPTFDTESWIEVTGGLNKGRIYGFGSNEEPKKMMRGSNSGSYSSTSRYFDTSERIPSEQLQDKISEEVKKLEMKMNEKIRQKEEEMEKTFDERLRVTLQTMLSQLGHVIPSQSGVLPNQQSAPPSQEDDN